VARPGRGRQNQYEADVQALPPTRFTPYVTTPDLMFHLTSPRAEAEINRLGDAIPPPGRLQDGGAVDAPPATYAEPVQLDLDIDVTPRPRYQTASQPVPDRGRTIQRHGGQATTRSRSAEARAHGPQDRRQPAQQQETRRSRSTSPSSHVPTPAAELMPTTMPAPAAMSAPTTTPAPTTVLMPVVVHEPTAVHAPIAAPVPSAAPAPVPAPSPSPVLVPAPVVAPTTGLGANLRTDGPNGASREEGGIFRGNVAHHGMVFNAESASNFMQVDESLSKLFLYSVLHCLMPFSCLGTNI
jgi:hypothetical protein